MTELDNFLVEMCDAARDAGHCFPIMAACEVALESNWGKSKLAKEANNLFGRKWSGKGDYIDIPTKEFIDGEWVTETARWLKFPDHAACFRDRMDVLKRLAPRYDDYRKALEAPDGETFVRCVSRTWATDPKRADKVLAIFRAHRGALEQGES